MWKQACISTPMISRGFWLFLVLAFCAQGASAEDFHWYVSKSGKFADTPSPTTSCGNLASQLGFRMLGISPASGYSDRMVCNWEYLNGGSWLATNGTVYRRGDSCPADTNYNSSTGECEGNICQQKSGQSQPFVKSGSGNDDYMFISADGKFSAAAQGGCFDSCSASTAEQRCIVKSTGNYVCRGTAVFDGTQCGTGTDNENTPPVEEPESVENPDPQTTTETEPCVMAAQPDGTQGCTSSEKFDKEGQVCGVFNGERVCPTQQPQSDTNKVDTKISEIPNADGSVTTVKEDTQTKTVCNGTKCTTTTSTKTTTTKKDANGNVIDSNTSCTGANCAHSGNPDTDGDGFGNSGGQGGGSCDPATNPAGCGGSSLAGESCSEPVQCTGDAIQCAIFRQEKISQCADEEWRDLSEEKVAEAKTQLEQGFTDDEYQPFEYTADNTIDLSASFDQSGFLSGSCPAFPDWTFDFGDEPVVVPIASLFSDFCQYWIYFGYLIVAFAIYRATGIVLGGMN